MSWLIIHTGSGTYFEANDEVVVVNTLDLTEQEIENMDNDFIEDSVLNKGVIISDEMIDELVEKAEKEEEE